MKQYIKTQICQPIVQYNGENEDEVFSAIFGVYANHWPYFLTKGLSFKKYDKTKQLVINLTSELCEELSFGKHSETWKIDVGNVLLGERINSSPLMRDKDFLKIKTIYTYDEKYEKG